VSNLSEIKLLEDLQLVALYKQTRDNNCVGVLFERHTQMVLGVCMKYLKDADNAHDAVMQIFEKLLTDLGRHSVDNFKGWLYMVAKNHCLMQLRAEQTKLGHTKEMKKDFPVLMETEYKLHLDKEPDKESTLTKMEHCIKKLNEQQKIAVELFYLQEKCYQEVADATGFSMNEVKSFIQNGKRNIKICMEKN
jgi:RNA polymerase sigma-70 factor (ECF subfamily)